MVSFSKEYKCHMDASTTKQLEEILSHIQDEKQMEKFMEHPKVSDSYRDFISYYLSLPSTQNLTDTDLIERSGLEKSYYYQIRKGTRHPSRDKVLRLCIGGNLSLRETTRALELNGSAPLYPKNRRDIILTVALNQKASLIDTNLLLDQYGEEPLA